MDTSPPEPHRPTRPKVSFGKRSLPLPHTKWPRIAIGSGLVVGGTLGFLPILGFWMIPLGLLVLSVDLPFARRWRRRLEVYWGRKKREWRDRQLGEDGRLS